MNMSVEAGVVRDPVRQVEEDLVRDGVAQQVEEEGAGGGEGGVGLQPQLGVDRQQGQAAAHGHEDKQLDSGHRGEEAGQAGGLEGAARLQLVPVERRPAGEVQQEVEAGAVMVLV